MFSRSSLVFARRFAFVVSSLSLSLSENASKTGLENVCRSLSLCQILSETTIDVCASRVTLNVTGFSPDKLRVRLSPSDYSEKCINSPHIELNDIVLFAKPHNNIHQGHIGLNGVQRKHLRVSTRDEIQKRTNFKHPARRPVVVVVTMVILTL